MTNQDRAECDLRKSIEQGLEIRRPDGFHPITHITPIDAMRFVLRLPRDIEVSGKNIRVEIDSALIGIRADNPSASSASIGVRWRVIR